ncbi:hypothetical protein FHG87_020993 [Trinorchestia longiramus]|nr:hypothetical protein FHG87_020993 [Trinorchestia longiramus]
MTTLQAVQYVTEPLARNLVANTAVWLTRASKDKSAILGLAAAERQIEVTLSQPQHTASAQESVRDDASAH